MEKLLKSLILVIGVGTAGIGQIYMEMAMDSTMSYEDIVNEGESFYDSHGRGQHTGYKSFKRWQYWMKRCLDKKGHMMSGAKINDAFQEFQASEDLTETNLNIPIWTDLGPYSAGNTNGWSSHLGRITSIAVDDNNLDHILVGSPTGGVWKTTDGGSRWTPIYDFETVLDIYSIAISPHNPNHYYIGTWGAGIRRSIDGGQTWKETSGVNHGTRIIDIAISPSDPKICVAINEGGNVFQSSNSGDRWDVSLLHSGTLYDVEFKPNDNKTVYVSGKGAIFTSSDNGWTFTELDGPWKNSGMIFNPIMLAVTPADPNYIYALEGDNGGFGALYLSKDGGSTFTTQSSDSNNDNNLLGYVKTTKGGQAPRDMDIAVSPLNKDEIHLGGIMTHRSLDQGKTWEQTSHWLRNDPLPFIHADVDIIVYKAGRAFFGTDGGLFTSDDSGVSFTDRSSGLSIRQFYRMAISKDGELLVGGSQDNGVGLLKDSNGWWDFVGADGMEPIIDKDNKDLIYASIQYGNVYKTKDGGVTLSGDVTQTPGFGEWVTPLEQDPIISNTLYQGKSQLYKTSDGMKTWSIISDFVHTDVNDTLMQEIDISPVDNNFIVVGFEEKIYKTTNGGASWSDISPTFDFSNVNYISIHPTDKNWITVALSGTDARVVQSTNGGASWQNIMANLPDVGAECVLYEGGPKNGIYVSMNPGIYYRDGSNTDWQMVSPNMPNVLVAEMEISGCKIYAATYGRGIWSASLIDDTEYFVDLDNDGFGDENSSFRYCEGGQNYTLIGGDCNDADASIHPDATEVCNGSDDDCNGLIDGSDPNSFGTQVWYRDADGDSYGNSADRISSCSSPPGYVLDSGDCDDTNANIHPDSPELCNGLDDDCNGLVDGNDPSFSGSVQDWYRDSDGDGYGDIQMSQSACSAPSGYVSNSTDCNDRDSSIHPDAAEICNGIDDNCNRLIDTDDPNSSIVIRRWYRDQDGDGYGNNSDSQLACAAPLGYVDTGMDCDDRNSAVNPSAIESCNGVDDDCNGLLDDNDPSLVGGLQDWYRDSDGDGYGNIEEVLSACSSPSGYVSDSTDCNDNDPNVHPNAAEICNNKDDNCNGLVDIDDPNSTALGTRWYRDQDGDGYGDDLDSALACEAPPGYVAIGMDCDDNNSAIHPDRDEICNGLDDNCNGLLDSADSELVDGELWYLDADGDGYGNDLVFQIACAAPSGYVANSSDCDDNDGSISPAGTEICNGIDDDCNGLVDGNDPNNTGATQSWYRDSDGDGYGNSATEIISCEAPSGYVSNDDDCDDNNSDIHPAGTEICNGIDDDCNGLVDGNDPNNTGATQSWYRDSDGDGYGNSATEIISCEAPSGYVSNDDDCNDRNADIHPDGTEICNGIDDNCNGLLDSADSELIGGEIWYLDADGDGYGNALTFQIACAAPSGYVANSSDCDDNDGSISPAGTEICNGIDDDCNGLVDGNDPNSTGASQSWYLDEDRDGYGSSGTEVISCEAPLGYVSNDDDCNDNNSNIHPEGTELCNGLDDNCNGLTDSADSDLVGARLWYSDLDGDGYGLADDFLYACARPRNFVSLAGDCDDENSEISPDAEELCDGIDNNCNGVIDENCASEDCDGNYLFIHAAFQEAYHAGTDLISDAQLTGVAPQLYAAGVGIDLLPGFEVELGKEFQAIIKPCFNGVSPLNPNLKGEFQILGESLERSLKEEELVQLKIIDRALSKTVYAHFSKSKIDFSSSISKLDQGQYTLLVEAPSFTWNRDIDVIGHR